MAETKPIDEMLKAELLVEVKARMVEVALLKELILSMAQPTKPKRWPVYGRGSV